MTKMLDMARLPGPCGGRCPNAVTRPVTAVPISYGYERGMRDAASSADLNRRDASLVRRLEAGILKAFDLYRQLVDVEIGRASEHGARWWSRRLVEMYEEVGLLSLDK